MNRLVQVCLVIIAACMVWNVVHPLLRHRESPGLRLPHRLR